MQSNGVMQCCNAKCKASKVCEKCSFLYGSLVVVSFLSVQLHLLGHNKSKFSKKCQIQDNQNERLRRFLSLNSATYRTKYSQKNRCQTVFPILNLFISSINSVMKIENTVKHAHISVTQPSKKAPFSCEKFDTKVWSRHSSNAFASYM